MKISRTHTQYCPLYDCLPLLINFAESEQDFFLFVADQNLSRAWKFFTGVNNQLIVALQDSPGLQQGWIWSFKSVIALHVLEVCVALDHQFVFLKTGSSVQEEG